MDEDNEYDVSMSHALVDFFSTISHSPVSVVDFGSGLVLYYIESENALTTPCLRDDIPRL